MSLCGVDYAYALEVVEGRANDLSVRVAVADNFNTTGIGNIGVESKTIYTDIGFSEDFNFRIFLTKFHAFDRLLVERVRRVNFTIGGFLGSRRRNVAPVEIFTVLVESELGDTDKFSIGVVAPVNGRRVDELVGDIGDFARSGILLEVGNLHSVDTATGEVGRCGRTDEDVEVVVLFIEVECRHYITAAGDDFGIRKYGGLAHVLFVEAIETVTVVLDTKPVGRTEFFGVGVGSGFDSETGLDTSVSP